MANKKVLYFISGPVPTDAERKAARNCLDLEVNVYFRNASGALSDTVEKADAFAGAVPANYKAQYPKVPILGDDGKENTVANERLREDAWAAEASLDDLKKALTYFKIGYGKEAKVETLRKLFLARHATDVTPVV